MTSVIIAGAGVGGLYLAGILEKKGYYVTVIEKNLIDNLSYNWHDDVERNTFVEAGIPIESLDYHLKQDWSFAMFGSKSITKISIPDSLKDLSIHRRSLAKILISQCLKTKFLFSHIIEKPIIKDSCVIGVSTNKGDFFADLIIDNCGYNSPIRSQLPDEAIIDRNYSEDEVFHVYRAFWERKKDIERSFHTNKAYLRHMGRKGISWAIDKNNEVDILVGSVERISDSEIDAALVDLKIDNPVIGEKTRSEGKYVIPVRSPIRKMIWNGYALLGDSAFMTIPMLGSGINSSLKCGKILSEIIFKCEGDFKEEKLWEYQVICYKGFLYQHFSVDIMKRWLLKAKLSDISFISDKGLVNAEEMAFIASGKPFELSFSSMVKKAIKGFSNPALLLALLKTLNKGKKAMRIALKIPTYYTKNAFLQWANKLNSIFD